MKAEWMMGVQALMLLVAACAVAPAMADATPPSSQAIQAALQPFVDSHSLAGAVALVADKSGILSLDTVGFEDVQAGKKMRPDDLFWIASQTKPITATAFMMLVDAGKVSLDDPVSKYLPEFNNVWVTAEQDGEHMLLRRPKHAITIREILSHTAGMPFSSPMEQPTLDMLPLREGVMSYAMTPLQYEPGTKYQYSNAGINTAGRIIEVVSGMPYEEFLQKRLLDPLGMKDTTFWPSKAQAARIAKSYRPSASQTELQETTIGQLKYPLDDRSRKPMPAGGLFSTAADVARFCRMILNGGELDGKRYVSEAAIREMTKKQTPAGVQDSYGLGWVVGDGWCGHGGAYATNMTVDTKRGLVTVYLVQHAGFPNNGAEAQGAFQRAANEQFAKGK